MKCQVIAPFETVRGEIPAGTIVNIPDQFFEMLQGKVIPIPTQDDGRDLPHYCQAGDCWCSMKLPESDYPAGCFRTKCEHVPHANVSETERIAAEPDTPQIGHKSDSESGINQLSHPNMTNRNQRINLDQPEENIDGVF